MRQFTDEEFHKINRVAIEGNHAYDRLGLRAAAREAGFRFRNSKAMDTQLLIGVTKATERVNEQATIIKILGDGPPTTVTKRRGLRMVGELDLIPTGTVVTDTPPPDAAAKNLKALEVGATWVRENAKKVGTIVDRIYNRRRQADCPQSPIKIITRPTLPASFAFPLAVLSDLHVPMHDSEFIDKMIDFCVERGVRSFVLAGDITDNNQWHKRTHDIRTERRWQDDITLARSVISHICANLGPGYIFFGNHDDWIMKATRGQMNTDWLYQKLFPDLPVTFSFKHQVVIPARWDGVKDWLIVHGERYSHGNPMGVVEKYALHAEMNVIAGHQHYASQWKSGSYNLIMNGGLMSHERMDYMVERPQPMRQQQRGFTIIDERGDATLYTEYQPWR